MATVIQKLPIGLSSFDLLRAQGKVYVDKTDLVARLTAEGSRYFLARPRRFGKSLLVSTLESLFRHGTREFGGLAIEKTWMDRTYDVLRLDFSDLLVEENPAVFQKSLGLFLEDSIREAGFALPTVPDQSAEPLRLFRQWLSERPVNSLVVLVDEYDAPLTACLHDKALFDSVRKQLSSFYAVLKKFDRALRFLFITGITRFQRTSIFSAMNNLVDISLDPAYGTLLGYTEEELRRYFGESLGHASEVLGMDEDELIRRMQLQYDGYCFDELASTHVFVPWSTLLFLYRPQRGFRNYWFESGGKPAVLAQYLKRHSLGNPLRYEAIRSVQTSDFAASSDWDTLTDTVLLTQAGYLTIRSSTPQVLYLGYPNREVAESMAQLYTSELLRKKNLAEVGAGNILDAMKKGETESFVKELNRALLAVDYASYPVRNEASLRALVSVFLSGIGLAPVSEVHGALGRSDLEVVAGACRWVMEFKFAREGDDPEKLLLAGQNQIRERRYGSTAKEDRIVCSALVFSEKERRIVRFSASNGAGR